jgi:polar amino acid transport system substrate-binding protein
MTSPAGCTVRIVLRQSLLAGVLALCLVSATTARAGDAVLQLAADEAWQPFIAPAQAEGGLIPALVSRVFAEAGLESEVTYLPWSRVLEDTASGHQDAIAGAYFTRERADAFLFTDEFLRFRVSLIGRRDFPRHHFESLEELGGHVVGMIRNAAYPAILYRANLTLHPSNTRQGLVRMLDQGRIDLLADTDNLFRYHALKAGLNPDDFVVLSPPLRDEPLYVAVSRQHPRARDIVEAFNRGLRTLKGSGEYLKIRRRYGF